MIGAGPAGLMAALVAGRAGARVILADEDFVPGGRLVAERIAVGGREGADWAAGVWGELAAMPNVRLMPRTTVTGVHDGGTWGALERVGEHRAAAPDLPRACFWRIVARRAVLAAGAIERPIAFPGNDRPGVMLAGAVRAWLNRWSVAPARAAVFTACDDGWRTAADLAAAGVEVAAIVDARAGATPPAGPWRVLAGAEVVATRGRTGLREISVRRGAAVERIAVDCLAVAGGWNPAVQLSCHLGGRPVWDERIAAFVPAAGAVPGLAVAGAAGGAFSTAAALRQGAEAAAAAVAALGYRRARGRGAGGRGPGRGGGGLLAGRGAGAGVGRLPERRDGEGPGAGGARGVRAGRARQALHDARDGDRPGQGRRRRRVGRCWRR